MTRITKHVWLYLTATFLALAAGCGAPSEQEDTTGSAWLFGTTAQAITSADVSLVRVTVSAADLQPRTAELVKTNNQWSGLIGKLPAGTGRTFSAEAFNSSGTKLYRMPTRPTRSPTPGARPRAASPSPPASPPPGQPPRPPPPCP